MKLLSKLAKSNCVDKEKRGKAKLILVRHDIFSLEYNIKNGYNNLYI